jgi:Zn-dependent M32 family carboxypeptidase
VIWRLLRRLYSSATTRTRSHPSIEELRTRIDDLETLDEHLSTSLDALVTEYETICRRAASADADQALRHELSQVILYYRSYRKQRQYARLACNYYRKTLQLLQDSTNDTEHSSLVSPHTSVA